MKPAARIQSAIEILDSVFEGARPADTIVTDYFKERRYAGSKDRRFISDFVFFVLRNRAKLAWMCEQAGLPSIPRSLVLAACIQKEEDIALLFDQGQYGPSPLSSEENDAIGVLAELDTDKTEDHIRLEYPQWLDADLRTSLRENFEAALQALNEEAALDLRINTLHPDHTQAQNLLAAQNIEVHPTAYSPIGLRSEKKVKLNGTRPYKEGIVDIQDEGSQLIALLSGAADKELVVDFCAGAGGKTLALAAQMNNKGHLYAFDIAAKRLFKMRRRLERANVQNVILHPINSESDPWLKQFEGRVDRLLIDAPCSGVGAWRRNPESRWKLTADLLSDLEGRQRRILDNAAHLVKKGGRLIYATCSLLKRENENQIERFLEDHGDFRLVPVKDVWTETIATPCPFDGDYMTMRPDLHKSDGFFCAILDRLG